MRKGFDSEYFIREPVVAGPQGFYPSDPDELRRMVRRFLDAAERAEEQPPGGLVAPHAGYVYSGPVAGWAYRQVEGARYRRVVVVAPSHREPFGFASVMPRGVYRTPLGDVPVDEELAREVSVRGGGAVQLSLKGHSTASLYSAEHSLEVQLPFLQAALGGFSLVPIVVGGGGWETAQALGDALTEILKGGDVLVVASSDLSHYHDYASAYRIDAGTLAMVKALDPEGLLLGCSEGALEACGAVPVAAMMRAAQRAGFRRARILRHATSGDVPGGMRDQVVGYLAAGFYRADAADPALGGGSTDKAAETGGRSPDREDGAVGAPPVGEAAGKWLLKVARETITAALHGEDISETEVDDKAAPEESQGYFGLFVTVKVAGRLRGCIGQMIPMEPLFKLVRRVALQAAFDDPRFPPLSPEELERMSLEVTIIGAMWQASSPDELQVGLHGVLLRRGPNMGVLLPQVATEQGWGREQFLEAVSRKAGLDGNAWRREEATLQLFTAACYSETNRDD